MCSSWALWLCAVGGWLVSAVCAAGWCDVGVMGYPDAWRSRTAERVYLAGIAVSMTAICAAVIRLFA